MARILWKQHRANHVFMSFSRSIYLRLRDGHVDLAEMQSHCAANVHVVRRERLPEGRSTCRQHGNNTLATTQLNITYVTAKLPHTQRNSIFHSLLRRLDPCRTHVGPHCDKGSPV
eukprot:2511764-Amphidinium_carterae.1